MSEIKESDRVPMYPKYFVDELKALLKRGKELVYQSNQETESLMDKACDWISDVDDVLGTNNGN